MVYDTIMVPFLCCIVVLLANGFFTHATEVKIQWLQDREDRGKKRNGNNTNGTN